MNEGFNVAISTDRWKDRHSPKPFVYYGVHKKYDGCFFNCSITVR